MSTSKNKESSNYVDVLSRIEIISPSVKGNDAELARVFGVSRTAPSQWKKRNKIPSENIISFALERGLNINWLLTGDGSPKVDNLSKVDAEQVSDLTKAIYDQDDDAHVRYMNRGLEKSKVEVLKKNNFLKENLSFLTKQSHSVIEDLLFTAWSKGELDQTDIEKYIKIIKETTHSDYSKVPVLDIDISAGFGTDVICEEACGDLAFSDDWLRDKSLKADQLAIVFAKGDSMQPTINSSDALLVDLRPIERITDGIHVIRINDHLYVKRLQSTFTGEVKIISDNTFYEAQTVAPDQLHKLNVIGKVVWIGKEV